MKFYSTNNKNNIVTFKEAVLKGIADDGAICRNAIVGDVSDYFSVCHYGVSVNFACKCVADNDDCVA